MTAAPPSRSTREAGSPSRYWARALELTSPIARNPERTFPVMIEEQAVRVGDAPALLSEYETFSYHELNARANRYARWAISQGIQKGDCVALFMPNRPEFVAIWLGITRVGGVVALLNTNLAGRSLAHCVGVVKPQHLIADGRLMDHLESALPLLASPPTVWVHGATHLSFPSIERNVEALGDEPLSSEERRTVTTDDRALYVFTSGTTGLPKAAILSHGRIMQWSYWFAGILDAGPADRLYDCLPMYHSVGGIQAPGALLVSGGAVVISEKFSASRCWAEVVQWNCTLFQYIGELCNYLVFAPRCAQETEHQVRLASGNGLRPDVWSAFQTRFQIPRILEFYASTEGNISLFNVEGERGSVGRIPPYLAHRVPAMLAKIDIQSGELARDERGVCIRCAPNETGELISKVLDDRSNFGARFEGYTSSEDSQNKLLRNAFESGDAWFRTGDLMRRDERGFFFFVDRIGDTFRWKGENVATAEVAQALCTFPGIKAACVYGVQIVGADGRAGMAAVMADSELDLTALRSHLATCLPEYARPLFLRIQDDVEMTATFKYTKSKLAQEGFDPDSISDTLYFNDPEQDAFVCLDQPLYKSIQEQSFARVRSRRRQNQPLLDYPALGAPVRSPLVNAACGDVETDA